MKFSVEEFSNTFLYKNGTLYWRTGVNKGKKAGWVERRHKLFYVRIEYKHSAFYAHKIIFYLKKGYCPKIIDHKNGNGLDNRIVNLREATSTENSLNSRKRQNTSSKHKGITFYRGRWIARIKINKKDKWLGSFLTEREAYRARKEAVKTHYGKFYREV